MQLIGCQAGIKFSTLTPPDKPTSSFVKIFSGLKIDLYAAIYDVVGAEAKLGIF